MSPVRKAVVLSAGLGTRLLPLTADRPKVMLSLAGQPLLERHVRWLRDYGITEFFFNLHAHPRSIQDYFGDGSRLHVAIHYSFEETLRGTAGALDGFRTVLTEPFLVHYGDVYSELDIRSLAATHRDNRAMATIAVHPSQHPHDSDIVEVDNAGRVQRLHHKPGTGRWGNLANAGCYLLNPEVLAYIPPSGESDFIRDVFPRMMRDGRTVQGHRANEFMRDMGTPERLEFVDRRLRS